MRIGIDIDGVVADSYPAWLEELNRHYGKNITVLEDYEMHLVFDVPFDDMNNYFVDNVEHLLSIPKPVRGAREGIESLIQEGHDIIYITARRTEEEEITLRWLEQYGIPHETVLFSGFKSKVDLVREWGIQAFVEDHVLNAEGIAHIGVPVFLMTTSYNRDKALPENVTRCADWEGIKEGLSVLADKAETG